MGQIVKGKKKGRPSKADLARRAETEQEKNVRRSLRRRNVRYTFDFDDLIDEDDEEDELGREKKLKQLLKLQSKETSSESTPGRTRRVAHAPAASSSSSDYGDCGKPLKKRKIDGDDEIDGDVDDDIEENEIREEEDVEVGRRKTGFKGADSVPGTPLDCGVRLRLPDKKSMEFILDKLQKKDTYGVYAEPVDPEELPDYHDVIEHPMDFATVRTKLGKGLYTTLEQFENDVFLICTNAMQYNAPDTVYYKQAHSIQELAKKKFQMLRIDCEHYDKDVKSEQKTRSNSLVKQQIKKALIQTTEESVRSDFSSGATAGDFQSGLNSIQAGGFDRLAHVDGPTEGNTSLADNNLDKTEDSQGRGHIPRFGRKPIVQDENRRATYNVTNQPMVGSESIFTTFDAEIKQLVAVGLHADHSYARSLALFAATLGPIAWKVASSRIEQALPPGFKFGRGWVGDYEPLPTPVLMLEKCSQKEPAFRTKLHSTSDARKEDNPFKSPVPVQKHPISFPTSQGKSVMLAAALTKPTTFTASSPVPAMERSVRESNLEEKQGLFGSAGSKPTTTSVSANYKQQSPRSRNVEPDKKVVKQVELNCPPTSTYQSTRDFVGEKQIPSGLYAPMETVSRHRNTPQPAPFKQPENGGFGAVGLPNGKVLNSSLDRQGMVALSSDSIPHPTVTAGTYFSQHGQEQGLSDPVQLMRMLAENAQKQQKISNNSPVDNPSLTQTIQSSGREDANSAAAAAARAWMSIGAGGSKAAAEHAGTQKNQISSGSLYNPTRELQPQISRFRGDFPASGMHFQPAKTSFPLQGFVAPPVRMGNEAQFQNRRMAFPELVTADLSRFQVQSPRQGVNLQRQRQESLPPDLNLVFQSTGSPGRQPTGVHVDSQQPDLALQL